MIGTINTGILSNGSLSLSLNGTNASIQISSFVLLGTSNLPFSFSIWINPTITDSGTILHASLNSSLNNSQWCFPFLGFTSSNQVHQQRHTVNIFTVGSSLADENATTCWNDNINTGQFYGSIDELRMFSRELTSVDVIYLSKKISSLSSQLSVRQIMLFNPCDGSLLEVKDLVEVKQVGSFGVQS